MCVCIHCARNPIDVHEGWTAAPPPFEETQRTRLSMWRHDATPKTPSGCRNSPSRIIKRPRRGCWGVVPRCVACVAILISIIYLLYIYNVCICSAVPLGFVCIYVAYKSVDLTRDTLTPNSLYSFLFTAQCWKRTQSICCAVLCLTLCGPGHRLCIFNFGFISFNTPKAPHPRRP